ncbi:MAG: toll/interleukin-1 receptor domain-containing protein [Candidatus Marinimicrobia bacterium]|nr:toll/interleukin-1 receptor domain-containing protein [Candidatus Neomarinimicrobiota bacterium]
MHRSKVFLCHSSADKSIIDRVASDLERLNIDVWYDKWEIKVGDSLIDKISDGISKNDYIAVFLSKHSIRSKWVKKELNAGLMKEINDKGTVILPVKLEDCKIPPLLLEKKYADFDKNYEKGFDDLLHAIYPSNPRVATRSRKFRLRQYFISGLTDIDETGENILNKDQLSALYEYCDELSEYMDEEEFRLILWSILSFRDNNTDNPFFMDISVPCWGLLKKCNSKDLAKWIMEGIYRGRHLSSLIEYYDFAMSYCSNNDSENLSMGVIMNTLMEGEGLEIKFLEQLKSWRFKLHKCIAKYHDSLYKTIWEERNIQIDQALFSYLILTSGYLEDSFSFAKYKSIIEIDDYYYKPVVYALCHQQEIRAMGLINDEAYDRYSLSQSEIANIFQRIEDPKFGEPLRDLMNYASKSDLVLTATLTLANVGILSCKELIGIIEKYKDDSVLTAILPLLVAAMRFVADPDENFLKAKSESPSPLVAGEAIAGLLKIGHDIEVDTILSVGSPRETEMAPYVMQAIEKYAPRKKYCDLLNKYKSHQNPNVRSSAIAALVRLGAINDEDVFELIQSEHNYDVSIAITRALVQASKNNLLHKVASLFTIEKTSIEDDFEKFVDNIRKRKMADLVRSTCDEGLHMIKGLEPRWWKKSGALDKDVVRVMPALANLLPDKIDLAFGHIMNRSIDWVLMAQKGN